MIAISWKEVYGKVYCQDKDINGEHTKGRQADAVNARSGQWRYHVQGGVHETDYGD